MAVVQYVVFKQGADIHVFWPQYFGALLRARDGRPRRHRWRPLARLRTPPRPRARPVLALGVALLPILAIARDGVPALALRARDGRALQREGPAHPLRRRQDGVPPLHRARRSRRTATVEHARGDEDHLVAGLGARRPHRRRATGRCPAAGARDGVYLADTRFLLERPARAQLARDFHVTAVGPFWKVAPGEPAAPIDAFAFVEREPSWWEWYLVSGTEPHRDVVARPLADLGAAHALRAARRGARRAARRRSTRSASPTTSPSPPATRARAAALLAEIERELRPVHAAFDDGTEIVGTTFHEGARVAAHDLRQGRRADDRRRAARRASRR